MGFWPINGLQQSVAFEAVTVREKRRFQKERIENLLEMLRSEIPELEACLIEWLYRETVDLQTDICIEMKKRKRPGSCDCEAAS